MSNLLPCPFCGGVPTINVIASVLYTAQCPECNSSSDVLKVKADVIAAWNTRQAPAIAAPSNTQQAAAAVLAAQEAKGIINHGQTLDTAGLSLLELTKHAQEEAADQLMYLTAMVQKLSKEAAQ